MSKALPSVTLVTALALLAGCGGEGGDDAAKRSGGSPAERPTTTIRISGFAYEPARAVVRAGTKIAISNADDAPHTVTDKGSARTFDSGTIKGKRSGSVTFSKAGTYAYSCEFHPTMAGTVTVRK